MYINDVLGSSKDISNERFLISEEIGLEDMLEHDCHKFPKRGFIT